MSRKRAADKQLIKDDHEREEDGAEAATPAAPAQQQHQAAPEVLAQRRTVRIKRENLQPQGGLFKRISLQAPPADPASQGSPQKEPAAPAAGAFAFPPLKPVELKPAAAGGAPATAAFNFTAPTSQGAKFGPPPTKDAAAFPPLQASSTFGTLASAFQPAGSSPLNKTITGFAGFGATDNKMAKIASASPQEGGSPATPEPSSTEVFTPSAPAFTKQDDAAKLLESQGPAETAVEEENTVITFARVLLKEANEAKSGFEEKGVGLLHVNEPKDTTKKPRLVMWRDQTQKVMLNLTIDKSFALASQELTTPCAFAFVTYDQELKRNRTYSLRVKKGISVEPLFDYLKKQLEQS